MNNEYIILNKETIQKRIEELGEITLKTSNEDKRGFTQDVWYDLIDDTALATEYRILKQVLSESIPLTPEIEKAWETCSKLKSGQNVGIRNKTEYISNLKLDI